jgi:uncharacterized membrane protein YphA (DoxX/SURF4 family)
LRLLRHPAVHWAIAIVIGGLFVYASLDKIAKPADFARIVYHYRILGPLPSNWLAVTLPWVELLAGVLMISGVWRREASLVIAMLLVVFMTAVGWALHMGIDIENCGCFSVSGEGRSAGWKLLAGDAAMLLGALVLLIARPMKTETAPSAARVAEGPV